MRGFIYNTLLFAKIISYISVILIIIQNLDIPSSFHPINNNNLTSPNNNNNSSNSNGKAGHSSYASSSAAGKIKERLGNGLPR